MDWSAIILRNGVTGIGETFSLLVPNVKGGASVPLAANEKAMEKANPMYGSIYNQLGQYWGEQPRNVRSGVCRGHL